MTLALLTSLTLSLTTPAHAAPPSGVTAPGLERICAAREEVDPDEDTIASASMFLRDQAELDLDAAAETLGLTREDGDPRVVVAGETVVVAASVGPGVKIGYTNVELLLAYTPTKVSFAGTSTAVEAGAAIVYRRSETDGKVGIEAIVYDTDGNVLSESSYSTTTSSTALAKGALVLSSEDGVDTVATMFMYGDIIMGSMPLDDFYD